MKKKLLPLLCFIIVLTGCSSALAGAKLKDPGGILSPNVKPEQPKTAKDRFIKDLNSSLTPEQETKQLQLNFLDVLYAIRNLRFAQTPFKDTTFYNYVFDQLESSVVLMQKKDKQIEDLQKQVADLKKQQK